MSYKKNYKIDAHIHKNNIRKVIKLQRFYILNLVKLELIFITKKIKNLKSYLLEKR